MYFNLKYIFFNHVEEDHNLKNSFGEYKSSLALLYFESEGVQNSHSRIIDEFAS